MLFGSAWSGKDDARQTHPDHSSADELCEESLETTTRIRSVSGVLRYAGQVAFG
jgi:hypothetical protein